MDRGVADRLDRSLERVVAQTEFLTVDPALGGRTCIRFAHVRFHGITRRPEPADQRARSETEHADADHAERDVGDTAPASRPPR